MRLNRKYVLAASAFGFLSVLLTVLSKAFSHGSVVIAIIVFGLLSPAWSLATLLGLGEASHTVTYVFVFVVQSVAAYALFNFVAWVRRESDQTGQE